MPKIDAEVRAEVAVILDRLKTERGITESLKATDPLRWVQKMLVAEEATKNDLRRLAFLQGL